jgi:citrate synthase
MELIKIDVNYKSARMQHRRFARRGAVMSSGLDDVVVAETVLSEVDGLAGRLVIRGHCLEDLVAHATYERVLGLLWEGFFPALPASEHLPRQLGAARCEVFGQLQAADARLLQGPLFDVVRALIARIGDGDDLETALLLVAAPAVFTCAVLRRQRGLAPIPPDPGLGHAADMLRMLHGEPATPERAAALDRYLITASDHGLNASTFVARIVASTRAGLASVTVAAMSALKGPLHGGAPGPVLDMLDSIGSASHATTWLQCALARGERLMGFGHRVYRVRDPRADALKEAVSRLTQAGQVDAERLRLAQAVEAAALDLLARKKPDRPLQTNTEFYTALLLEALGLPRQGFTCAFAAGRTAGWIAHAREQMLNGRLIRPQSRYVGPPAGSILPAAVPLRSDGYRSAPCR